MSLIITLFLLCSDKQLQMTYVEPGPVIDGYIENIWLAGDSAYDFVQHYPDEKEPAGDRTVVYALQDDHNLYFAFRCYTENYCFTRGLTKEEDNVAVAIDPFGSRTTAYYFLLNASGLFDDGWIVDDGRTYDDSWDGVWYKAIKKYDDRYEVEFKIPFKSIRYKKGLEKWGIQFLRYITENNETDYWTEVTQIEGDMISKWPALTGVRPRSQGYYFELYPEAYFRYNNYTGEDPEYKPSASMNVKWDITPQMTFNATAFPDFAQIESDPFSLNLGRYPTYLDERRPFFLEGKDIFRMSDFGEGKGFFDPLEIFYSRRVGKSVNGEAIPIIGGGKVTIKSQDWNIGFLGAYTDEYEHICDGDTLVDPDRGFGVLRAKHRIIGNSDIGLLYSGSFHDPDDYNQTIGMDLVYRQGMNQFILQGAASDHNQKCGWAANTGFFGLIGNFLTIAKAQVVNDSFDVSDIGFVPWAGMKEILLLCGPYYQWRKSYVRNLFIAPGAYLVQEPGSDKWSTLGMVEINPNFKHNWGFDLSLTAGPYYEADTNYLFRQFNWSIWGRLMRHWCNLSTNYTYTYNYFRDYLAYRSSNSFSYNYSIIDPLSVGISSNLWIEWDTTNAIIEMTPRLRSNILYRFNAVIKLSVFTELVMTTPGIDFGSTGLNTMRTGALFSWNFLPKSWIYVAINDYRIDENNDGELDPKYLIGAIKASYLLYF
ncbi:hypothetical protein A2Y85_01985 [candidate division WOR-3 bacterium RBG_13_43_14]|uniref:DUF5916 domain-containing protein n=1 Tax=candidate division WOR-3 bacterium RBG_13_43_14 TaxID=1802590 RepID=A0A1F4UD52_UNCW3|nr:MAG: hypothetical protein A2Y85_01985 [candidate division WOR-3 bacterium RBG_13_43_14]